PEGLHGTSLLPLLEDPDSDGWTKELVFTISRNGGESIRTHDWRFNHWGFGKKGEELYDLENDPGEFTNLAGDPEYTDNLEALRSRLREKRDEAGYDPKKYK
ncbi:MAG: sulfatase/phosphatase domain-containing protein, partial [Verrucomicrobiota bacterium]